MKKIISLTLALSMIFMVACKDKQKDNSSSKADNINEKPKVTELIIDGDFAKNETVFWSTYFNGGDATVLAKNEEMVVHIKNAGQLEYAVQVYQDTYEINQGCRYRMSFDARSTVDRAIEVRLQINGGDYHAYALLDCDLTSEMKTYTLEFDMLENTDPAPRFALNLGYPKGYTGELGEHDIYFDNISIKLIDESKKVETPPNPNLRDINVNQIGYFPDAKKIAVFRGDLKDKEFEVINAKTNQSVYKGTISKSFENETSGETNWYGDFSSVKEEGTYYIQTKSLGKSYEFKIGNNIYNDVTKDIVKMLYLQRCGTELTSQYAGDFAHKACHTTKAKIYGTNTYIDVSGGWHDAGDYGRYVVPASKAVADLLLAYQFNSSAFDDNLGIPESGNGIPDILDEARYELEWLFKMQDQASGGVYHKVTCADFPGTVMPEEETEELIVSKISDAATADFAAVMALSYETYKNIDGAFAEKCLNAAKKAWNYVGDKKTLISFSNPKDILTGEYGDGSLTDEMMWADAQLFKATGDSKYLDHFKKIYIYSYNGLGWADVGGYGQFALLTTEKSKVGNDFYEKVKSSFLDEAEFIIRHIDADGYKVSLEDQYPWGSNMSVANDAMYLLFANKINPEGRYLEYARYNINYIFGTNPMSMSYVTGAGSVSPQNTHHRPSQVLKKSMPGMLVGGPDSALEDPYARAVLRDTPPAKCYVDNEQSYSCNEVTIYWNSPLIFAVANIK